MNRKALLFFAAGIVLNSLCHSPRAHADVTLLDQNEWRFLAGGFVELEMFADSSRSFTEVVGDAPVARNGTLAGDNGRTEFSVRNSRLDFSILPPAGESWKTKGYLEFDLLGYEANPGVNSQSESNYFVNATFRLREAILQADSGGWFIMAGQYWTLFGWQMAYLMPSVSDAPVPGEMYERTPQVTLIKTISLDEQNNLFPAVSLTRPVQRDSQIPGIDAGLRATFGGRKAASSAATSDIKVQSMSAAITGSLREFESQTPGGSLSDKTHYLGSAIAADVFLPIITVSDVADLQNSLTITGEFTSGQGYGDQFPNWTGGLPQPLSTTTTPPAAENLDAGQGDFDSTGSFQLIHLQTWNLSMQYFLPTETPTFISAGYGQLYSNNIDTLVNATTGLTSGGNVPYDRAETFFANVMHDFTPHVRVALEISHVRTHYADDWQPHNNRLQVSTWFRF